jgi:PQQ-like domain
MLGRDRSHSVCLVAGSLPSAAFAGAAGPDFLVRRIVRGLSRILGGRGRAGNDGRATAYRPTGEGLESKTLLSNLLGWSGGNAGNSNSSITPANISTLTEEYSHLLDGEILAEPVTATVDVTVGPNQGTQNVVFVATEQDTLYAFNVATGQLLWQTSFLEPGETPLPFSVTHSDVNGITGTPVIDPSTNTIYLVTTESYVAGNVTDYSKTLHAVDMSDGTEQPGSPVVIADTGYNSAGEPVSLVGPSVRGTGAGSVDGRVPFYVERQLQRVALSIVGDDLVIGIGSFGDIPPEHGWILLYNKNSLQLTGVFNDTPNGSDGGIWNSGGPIQTDAEGYLYTETGNGTFDTKLNRAGFPSGGDYGDSVLKLEIDPGYTGPNGTGIKVVDYYTPTDQAKLDRFDGDLASSGVLILPDGWGGRAHPNLLLASGKRGTIYLINRNRMGHFHRFSNAIVQTLNGAITASYDTPAFFDNTVYYAGANDFLKSFNLVKGHLVKTGRSSNAIPYPGASPVVSSDGTQNGIIWVLSHSDQMIAYNASDLTSELWSAPLPGYSQFSIPAITGDGHVEVGAGSTLVGFGLGGA